MHQSAMFYGRRFFEVYCSVLPVEKLSLIEVGSQNVNGSLREVCPPDIRYTGLDFVKGDGVDILIADPYQLPLPDGCADIVVSSSCFEHSEFFWLVFLEILRILKPHGLFYLNVPTNGFYHRWPMDCWRLYPDSGHALIGWAKRNNHDSMLLESFVGGRSAGSVSEGGMWNDFVAVYLKDRQHRGKFSDRIVHSLVDFSNGYSSEREGILNHNEKGPDFSLIEEQSKAIEVRNRDIELLSTMVKERDDQLAILHREIEEFNRQLADFKNRNSRMEWPSFRHPLSDEMVQAHQAIREQLIGRNKIQEAIFVLEKLIETLPKYAAAYSDLAILHAKIGNAEIALAFYEKAVSLEPDHVGFRKTLADFLHVVMQRPEEAIQHYEAVLKLNPSEIETLLVLGNLRASKRQFVESLGCFVKLIEIDPQHELAGRMVDTLITKWTRFEVSEHEPIINIARSLTQIGRLEQAIGLIETVINNDADHAEAHNALGDVYRIIQKPDKALFHFSRAVQLRPDRVRFLTDLADLHLAELGNVGDALRLYNTVLAKNSNDIDVMLKIGNICATQRLFEDAAFFYLKVLLLDPDNTQAKENLSVLKTMAQETDVEIIPCPFCLTTESAPARSAADIVKCLSCDTVYLRTRLKKTAMKAVYQTYADGSSHMTLPADVNAIKSSGLRRDYFLDELLEFAVPEGRLLDVGCGWGAFLDNARDRGFSVSGIEVTGKCIAFANEKLRIPVTDESFEDAAFEDESISVVTMLHALEHLPEPLRAMANAHRILMPGGVLCGIVPNIQSFCSRETRDKWYWLDPQYHYVHYSPNTLRHHLEKAGFMVERLYTATGDYGRDNVLKVLQQRDRNPSTASVDALIDQLEKEGLGEEIRFFARKPGAPVLAGRISPEGSSTDPGLCGASGASSPSGGSARASIIIPVFNQVEFTARCLHALYQNTPHNSIHEVIVVDNASSDGTREFLQTAQERYPRLKVLINRENLLFAKACNQGGEIARGDYLVFLNNDTEPTPGWLDSPLARLQGDESIGVVGVKLLYPDGSVQHCGIQFQRNANPSYSIWPVHRYPYASADDPKVNEPEDVHAVTGACLFIGRELFRRIGGFEEKYGMYFEDTDLCFKVRRTGKRVFYEPASVVIHHQGKSSPSKDAIDDLNAKAGSLFFKIWRDELYRIEFVTLIQREEGKYVYLSPDFWRQEVNQSTISGMHCLIKNFPDCYVHFGGSGDALLLLSTFYDRDGVQSIVSVSNSANMMRCFFDAFPKLKRVYFIPFPQNYIWHFIARRLFKSSKNCLGLGATPTTQADYKEWNETIEIFKAYGIQRRPAWAVNFQQNRLEPLQVVIQPKGSLKGMVGSKRNVIDPQDWPHLLSYLSKKGIRPIIIGTPDEAVEYSCFDKAIDKRSCSFFEQMKLIAGSDFFIGADSWGKTFSALAGIKAFVFHSMRGDEMKGWKDASDFVFLDPWEEITVVRNFSEFRKTFDTAYRRRSLAGANLKIRWEGSQFVNHSLALVNREQCLRLIAMGCEVSIIPYERDQLDLKADPRFNALAERTNKALSGPANVHIRHQWPPNFSPPPEGHWVIIQPWEFGSIPQEWVRRMSSNVDEVWVPSWYVRDCYIRSGVPSERVFVIPNGVNTSLFNPQSTPYPLETQKEFKFLFIGGTIKRKGIDILLDAYTKTFISKDEVCLVIKDMGGNTFYKGQTAERLIEEYRSAPDAPEIEYIQNPLTDKEMAGLYTACNCLVHPYRGEGFGLPVAEAMASELPVIVTGHGAALDFCSPDNSYLLTAKETRLSEKRIGELDTVDYPWLAEVDRESLAAAMKHVIAAPGEAKEKARAARAAIEMDFTWEKAACAVIRRVSELSLKPVVRFRNAAESQQTASALTVSIIIRVSNDLKTLRKCFQNLKKHTRETHEILFVVNRANSKALKWVKRNAKENVNCKCIENKEDYGWAKEINHGIKESSGDHILILDSRAVVGENWLPNLLECMEHGLKTGIVGSMSQGDAGLSSLYDNYPGPFLQEAENDSSFRERNRHRRILVQAVNAPCLLFKRRLVDEIGLMDERLDDRRFGVEDFCLRASLAGYQNTVAGDVWIPFYVQGGSADDSGAREKWKTNRRIFNEKWHSPEIQQKFGQRLFIYNATAKADELYRKGQIEKAAASMLEAIKKDPGDRNLYIKLSEMLIDAKNFDGARGILDSLPQAVDDARWLASLACCEEGVGRDDKAQENAACALAIDPFMTLALNISGVVAYKRGEREAAEGWFKKAIESDPGDGESYTNLGTVKWEQGEHAEALDLFEHGFILSPNITDVVTAYHSAVSETGAFSRAEEVFREARALHPNDRRISFFLIALLIQHEKNEFAMREIEQAIMKFGIDDGILAVGIQIRDKIGLHDIAARARNGVALSVCMIVKNEEKHLAKCLASVKPIVSEMIVVDTGSNDRTKDIAEAFGAKVFDFAWSNDFSEARNYSLSKATGEWVLVMDADECLSPADCDQIMKILKTDSRNRFCYAMTTRNYTNQSSLRGWTANDGEYHGIESGDGWVPSTKVRLFPNHKGLSFVGAVHELVEPTLRQAGIGMRNCDVPVHHYGKLDPGKVISKGSEYYRLGLKKIEETNGGYQALKELAVQASELEEYGEAVNIWEKAIALNPNDAVACMNAGYAYFKIDNFEKAADLSMKALELDPHLREAALNLSGCELMLGNILRAITLLEGILAKEPDYPPAMGRIAAAYIIAAREKEGLEYLRRLRQRDYNCSMLIEEQAQALSSLGRTHEALLLREAVRKLSDSAPKSRDSENGLKPTPDDRLVPQVEKSYFANIPRRQTVQPNNSSC